MYHVYLLRHVSLETKQIYYNLFYFICPLFIVKSINQTLSIQGYGLFCNFYISSLSYSHQMQQKYKRSLHSVVQSFKMQLAQEYAEIKHRNREGGWGLKLKKKWSGYKLGTCTRGGNNQNAQKRWDE